MSGAQSYRELCLTARNEEKQQLAELKKRQRYLKPFSAQLQPAKPFPWSKPLQSPGSEPFVPPTNMFTSLEPRKCFLCQKPGHLARDCRSKTAAGAGHGDSKTPSSTKQVTLGKGRLTSRVTVLFG